MGHITKNKKFNHFRHNLKGPNKTILSLEHNNVIIQRTWHMTLYGI